MRIISKLINSLGEKVSAIESPMSQSMGGADANIIVELSEENDELKARINELQSEVALLTDKAKALRAEMEDRANEYTTVVELIVREAVSSKISIPSTTHRRESEVVTEFVREMVSRADALSAELSKKEEKQHFLEDMNRDLKIAYSTIAYELSGLKSALEKKSCDAFELERAVQKLRAESVKCAEREKELTAKVGELEEQRFYLKETVQRLSNRSCAPPEKDSDAPPQSSDCNSQTAKE
jgi:chromosome segregation ATPase